ncbi:MAG TPA: M23 family metallopeptidase [Gaiella sp.]|nr:M23 family metallopeptidase [Gaiella sp.]
MHRLLLLGVTSVAALVLSGSAAAWSWPADGDVLRAFTLGSDAYAAGQHRGIDIAGPEESSIRAPASGTVSFAGSLPTYGLSLTILTAEGYAVTLVHLGSVEVAKGEIVEEGAAVATMGSSGDAEHSVATVHLGVRVASQAEGYVDPLGLLPPRAAPRPSGPASHSPVTASAPAASPAPAPPATATAGTQPPAAPAPAAPGAAAAPVAAAVPAASVSSASAAPHASAAAGGPVAESSPASPAPDTAVRSGSVDTVVGSGSSATGPDPVATTASSAADAESAAAFTVTSPAHRAVVARSGNAPGTGGRRTVPLRSSVGRLAALAVVTVAESSSHGRPAGLHAADGRVALAGVRVSTTSAPVRHRRERGDGTVGHDRDRVVDVHGTTLAENRARMTPPWSREMVAAALPQASKPKATADAASQGGIPHVATGLAALALIVLLALGIATRAARRIAGDGAVLRHHADLLRQLHAAHRARVHDRGSGRLRASSAATRS